MNGIKRIVSWLFVRPERERTAYYPNEEPLTRSELKHKILSEGKAPLDDHPSADWGRQQPLQ
jgi:hypothetical protein